MILGGLTQIKKMKEIWKDIKGYNGLYQVSNLGRVKSLNYHSTGKEKILLLAENEAGYLSVEFCKNGIRKRNYVHRLVAQTFIENPDNLPQVNHIDQNKKNNQAINLEWASSKYNVRYSHAKKVGCYKDGKLIKVYDAIIDVVKDGFYSEGVYACCKGKRNYHGGYQWKYIE